MVHVWIGVLALAGWLAGEAGVQSSIEDSFVLDHSATLSSGEEVSLEDEYKGRVVLIVNTASRCGFTPQYEGLQDLHETFEDEGLSVLAFPCNDFGQQEPGSAKEIVEFCTVNFGVTFPVFDKVEVLGDEAHPLFLDLRSQPAPIGGEPKWNFTKYLLNRNGHVIARFGPREEPSGEAIREAVAKALQGSAAESGDSG